MEDSEGTGLQEEVLTTPQGSWKDLGRGKRQQEGSWWRGKKDSAVEETEVETGGGSDHYPPKRLSDKVWRCSFCRGRGRWQQGQLWFLRMKGTESSLLGLKQREGCIFPLAAKVNLRLKG